MPSRCSRTRVAPARKTDTVPISSGTSNTAWHRRSNVLPTVAVRARDVAFQRRRRLPLAGARAALHVLPFLVVPFARPFARSARRRDVFTRVLRLALAVALVAGILPFAFTVRAFRSHLMLFFDGAFAFAIFARARDRLLAPGTPALRACMGVAVAGPAQQFLHPQHGNEHRERAGNGVQIRLHGGGSLVGDCCN